MKLSGRKVILLLSPFLALLLFPNTVNASESNVSIVNKVNTSTSSGGSTTGRTDIVIECNGEKKEYHSDKAENVNISCDSDVKGNVKSEVKISNISASPTASQTIKEEIKKMKEEVKEKKEEIKKEKMSILSEIKKIFSNIFKSFHL